jgi:hypothetical protein
MRGFFHRGARIASLGCNSLTIFGSRREDGAIRFIEVKIRYLDVLRLPIDVEDLLVAQREQIIQRAGAISCDRGIRHLHSTIQGTLNNKILIKEKREKL